MKKTVIILRGVSGCGKSALASAIADENTVICCADDFFMVNGEYRFNANALGYAHKVCREKFESAVEAGVNRIIVANTNTTEKEFNVYKDFAELYDYMVFSVVIENRHGNKDVHGVPDAVREAQEQRIKNSLILK